MWRHSVLVPIIRERLPVRLGTHFRSDRIQISAVACTFQVFFVLFFYLITCIEKQFTAPNIVYAIVSYKLTTLDDKIHILFSKL